MNETNENNTVLEPTEVRELAARITASREDEDYADLTFDELVNFNASLLLAFAKQYAERESLGRSELKKLLDALDELDDRKPFDALAYDRASTKVIECARQIASSQPVQTEGMKEAFDRTYAHVPDGTTRLTFWNVWEAAWQASSPSEPVGVLLDASVRDSKIIEWMMQIANFKADPPRDGKVQIWAESGTWGLPEDHPLAAYLRAQQAPKGSVSDV